MRRLVLVLVLLWLPLQGVAAVVMPFCKPAHAVPAEHTEHHAHHAGDQHHAPTLHACDDCGVCHLVCAPGVPSEAALSIAQPATEHTRFEPRGSPRFIPDQPQRPPLLRA
jgi:ferredoxin